MNKEKLIDKLTGVFVTLITALVVFYFASFMKREEVISLVNAQVSKEVKKLKEDAEDKYVRTDEVAVIQNQIKNLKEGQTEIKQDLKQILRKM